MASQSEPYDAVVIGGGVSVHSEYFVRERRLIWDMGP